MEKEKMQGIPKRMTGTNMLQTEEGPWPKKSNMVIPFSHGSSSAFRPWQPSWKSIGLGKQEASSSGVKATPQDNKANNNSVPKSNLGHVEKNHISGGNASACVGVGDQATQKLDPKRLKRILANRAAAQKSRLKKLDYIADLERMEKYLQAELSFLRPQVEVYKNQQWLLNVEHHQLRLEMAVREKERILQEVEIENMKAEVNSLRELQKKQVEAPNMRYMLRLWHVGRGLELRLPGFEFPTIRAGRCNRSKPSDLKCVADVVYNRSIINNQDAKQRENSVLYYSRQSRFLLPSSLLKLEKKHQG